MIVVAVILCAAPRISAQTELTEKSTLLGKKPLTGGYIGIMGKGGEIRNQQDAWIGGEVGAIFGHHLAIGIAGYGLVNSIQSPNLSFNDKAQFYQAGYGGLHIEPILWNKKVISISFPTLLGGGGIAETRVGGVLDELEDFDLDEGDFYNSDLYWVAEPGVSVALNVSQWMKITAGASYRYTYQLDMPSVDDDLLHGLNANVGLKFGWF